MQSTGHSSTQALSLTSTHGCAITYVMRSTAFLQVTRSLWRALRSSHRFPGSGPTIVNFGPRVYDPDHVRGLGRGDRAAVGSAGGRGVDEQSPGRCQTRGSCPLPSSCQLSVQSARGDLVEQARVDDRCPLPPEIDGSCRAQPPERTARGFGSDPGDGPEVGTAEGNGQLDSSLVHSPQL